MMQLIVRVKLAVYNEKEVRSKWIGNCEMWAGGKEGVVMVTKTSLTMGM